MLSPSGWVGAAIFLDLLLGDPRWLPHPVRGIGLVIGWADLRLREAFPGREVAAGIFLALSVVAGVYLLSFGWVLLFGKVHPLAGWAAQAILIFFSMAPRDLATHAFHVYRALKKNDLEGAKGAVAMLVGRDVAGLDEKGV